MAGQIHEVKLKVHSADTEFVDLSTLTETYTISDDTKPYYFTGTSTYGISITGGSPEIYLDNANVTNRAAGSAISITGNATPTIHVAGVNTVQASGDFDYGNGRGSGIYVAAGCTVTIKGNNRSDKLTALGQYDAAGIGGCYNGEDCGAINISNVTVTARGKMTNGIPPGIGSTGENKCGDITIDNATVYAYGDGNPKMTVGSPGIGAGASNSRCGAAPKVTIRNNSEVHTHRGGTYADYIGISSLDSREGGQVNAIVDETSVVYKYTGDGDTPDE